MSILEAFINIIDNKLFEMLLKYFVIAAVCSLVAVLSICLDFHAFLNSSGKNW